MHAPPRFWLRVLHQLLLLCAPCRRVSAFRRPRGRPRAWPPKRTALFRSQPAAAAAAHTRGFCPREPSARVARHACHAARCGLWCPCMQPYVQPRRGAFPFSLAALLSRRNQQLWCGRLASHGSSMPRRALRAGGGDKLNVSTGDKLYRWPTLRGPFSSIGILFSSDGKLTVFCNKKKREILVGRCPSEMDVCRSLLSGRFYKGVAIQLLTVFWIKNFQM